jgi:hypothetical protein
MKRTMTDRIRIGEADELVLSADSTLKVGNAPSGSLQWYTIICC